MKFKAKIGWWFYTIAMVMIFIVIYSIFMILDNIARTIFAIVIMTPIIFMFLHWIFDSYVLLEDKSMLIVLGFIKQRLSYDEVKLIGKTRNPMSSMALSFDRLGIKYGRNGYVMISVKDKDTFFAELKRRAPNIKIAKKCSIFN